MMMSSDHRCVSRSNVVEIKAFIYQKIGHQRANTYFQHLGKFLTSKLSKSDFDKLCVNTIGREHVPLHNRLVRSILANASNAKSPPPPRYSNKKPANHSSLCGGDSAFPRKCRSRKFRDRPSPLGPLGKPHSITTTNDESMSKAQRLLIEDGEEVEQMTESPALQSRSPLTAPFGVSFNVPRKSIFSGGNGNETCQSSGELPDSSTLMTRLEKKLEIEGIKLSTDSANVLNRGLNAFIKRLIEPCLSLASSRVKGTVSDVSMLDLRASVELNPRVLGEDWPVHLEKICCRASEE
ncbi:unnamed protein product [Cochlearia groenlandica]